MAMIHARSDFVSMGELFISAAKVLQKLHICKFGDIFLLENTPERGLMARLDGFKTEVDGLEGNGFGGRDCSFLGGFSNAVQCVVKY